MGQFVTDEEIKRINELYHKSKTEGLSENEKSEQAELREKYVLAVRESLRGSLNSISVKEADGTITRLKDRDKHAF